MKTVEEQLRIYADQARELLEPIDLEQVTARAETVAGRRPMRPWLVVATAVAAVVVLVGLLPFLLQGGDPETTSEPVLGESVVSFGGYQYKASGTQLLRRTADADWQEIPGISTDYPMSLTTDGDRLLAVSPYPTGLGDHRPTCSEFRVQVWTTEDGATWQTSDITDLGPVASSIQRCFVFSGGGESVGPGGALIVRVVTRPGFDDTYPHVWYSADGTGPWERVDLPSGMIGNTDISRGDTDISRIGRPVAEGNGFVIEIDRSEYDQQGVRVLLETEVWESPDGLTWTRSA